MANYDGITIKVNPADLQNAADVVVRKVTTLRQQFNNMLSKVESTANYWEGDASDTYRSEFKSEQPEFEEAFARMNEHATDLFNMAGVYTGVEKSISDMISSDLASDVIV